MKLDMQIIIYIKHPGPVCNFKLWQFIQKQNKLVCFVNIEPL